MTVAALAIYAVLLAVAAVAVWRRPVVALYAFVIGLAVHNIVLALLWGGGVRGSANEAIAAWKEALLAVAFARVLWDARRARRLPFRPNAVDWLALAFAAVVLLYAILPQHMLGGHAGTKAVLYAIRHDLVPVAAYFLGRSLGLGSAELRRLGWVLLGAAAAVAAFGLIEEYTVPVEWWRSSGAVGYFHQQLGFDYHGPGGLPENFAFNTTDGLFRRLVSTYISPLATAYMLLVALLLAPRRRLAAGLAAIAAVGLLFTVSRSALVALAAGLVVLAVARRRAWPAAAAAVTIAVGVGFAAGFTSFAPTTHFFKEDLPYQIARGKGHPLPHGGSIALDPGEPSFKSHLTNLRDGLKTVGRHPQGYGLGNAGATASRFGVPLKAGESNYTEIGVETGLAGMALFIAWSLALFGGLFRAGRTNQVAAGVAAALAAVLLLGIQTDAYGIPWLGYCLWWLCGAMVTPAIASSRSGDT